MFNITFLGTSSGAPTKQRNVSAIALECLADKNQVKSPPWFLIDCGEGTQHQLLKSSLSMSALVGIFITHVHGDHCYGLGGLLASLGLYGRKNPLVVIAPQAVLDLLHVLQELTEWHVNYPIDFIAIETLIIQADEYRFDIADGHHIAIKIHELSHRCPSYAFEFIQNLHSQKLNTAKLANSGIAQTQWRHILKAKTQDVVTLDGIMICPQDFIIDKKANLKIVIAGDNDAPKLLAKAVKNAKALIHEATYTDDVRQKVLSKPIEQGGFDPKHSSSKMVAQFAQSVGLPMLILTHFSARYALFDEPDNSKPNMGHIRTEVQQYYDGKLILAEDFLQVIID